MASMGGEGGLVGDLELCLVSTGLRRRMNMLRRVVAGLLQGGGDVSRDLDLAGRADVSARFGDSNGFLAEAYGEVTGDAGLEMAHG